MGFHAEQHAGDYDYDDDHRWPDECEADDSDPAALQLSRVELAVSILFALFAVGSLTAILLLA